MNIKSISKATDLRGKRVLMRVDFNVPIKDGRLILQDNVRIKASLETIKYIVSKGADVVIITHLGRPDGFDKSLSAMPLAKYLSSLLRLKVNFISDDFVKKDISTKIRKGVNFLENIRFYKEEVKNDRKFAKKLASFGDLYVNEAFSVCHRKDASVNAIQDFLPSYAGLFLEEEVINLSKLLLKNVKKNNRPYTALMGGAKIETKMRLINSLLKTADNVLLGGALIAESLRYQGCYIGSTLKEEVSKKDIERILKNPKVLLPVDVVVGEPSNELNVRIVKLLKGKKICNSFESILDIGPETILKFSEILKQSQTIVWNGPVGYFEKLSYAYGTLSLAYLLGSIGKGKAFVAVGGGETLLALQKTKMNKNIDWVSTGGGAMLSFLGGEQMPGFKKIIKI